ncbi:porphobilinogen deaminase [Pyrodictium occultum]|uniref:Probable porphobilinogen deaminase n=1 Tax=Pyrodictium occultum TaxID=2309 RepID=A0A0V8RVD7_PYROC|nr:hydroxymethylbilane synthase [Pyrodictium occultum]KSW12003.1 porphobilinogen deaminase [Pyrodictium occultum]
MKIRVATRGSKLSLAQTRLALEEIRKKHPQVDFELVIVRTRGDVHQDKPFTEIGGKGLFEREVNLAVLEGRADVAVHSLKDVPSEVSPGLVLAMTPPRASPFDVLVTREGAKTLWDLPSGAVVGSSSARRVAMLRRLRSDLVYKPLRGNVDTRLRKLREGLYDAIVLAEAGLQRLGMEVEYWRIPPDVLPPAPGQGIVGVYTLYSRGDLLPLLEDSSHRETMIQARAERAFLAYAGGGCHTPIGAYAWVEGGSLRIHAAAASPDGSKRVDVELKGDPERPAQLGVDAALELRARAAAAGIAL